MQKVLEKLSHLAVTRQKAKGMYHDGGGLYLHVKPDGGKSWAFRYTLHGRAREMGLGGFPALSLAEARKAAIACRTKLAQGQDPIENRAKESLQDRLAKAKTRSFRDCAEAYIGAHKAGWRNPKHIQQWGNTLDSYAYPVFGDIPVQEVDVGLVLKVLEPLWRSKTETASRLRGRIEAILDWARAREYRSGENPAHWRGHLENLLPKRSKVQRTQHQPALPYAQTGDFIALLREQDGLAAQALIFTILTAARTSEALGAEWEKFDLEAKLWTVPATRTKTGREHRVPLSDMAMGILKTRQAEAHRHENRKPVHVFEGQRKGKPLSNMAMLTLLRRMKREDITVHGFRSSFRDWAAEQTAFPREIAESSLAHISGDKVELAYRRTDLFDKRRLLMDAWARYCATPSVETGGKVVPLRRAKG